MFEIQPIPDSDAEGASADIECPNVLRCCAHCENGNTALAARQVFLDAGVGSRNFFFNLGRKHGASRCMAGYLRFLALDSVWN
jgi:hypothetical protein